MAVADVVNTAFDAAAPWKLTKEGKADEAAAVGSWCLEMFKLLTACLKPVLPALAAQAEAFLQCAPLGWGNAATPLGAGHTVGKYEHLMQRVDVKQLDALFEAPAEPEPEKLTPGGEELAPPSRLTTSRKSTCASQRSSTVKPWKAPPSCCA